MSDEFWNHLPAFAGTLPGWITSGGVIGILALFLRYNLGIRKLRIEAGRVEVEANEVSDRDEADIRDHYADEVRQLRERLDRQSERHREILAASDLKHEDCQRDREQLREDSRSLKDIVRGLIRIITQASASKAILLDSHASAEVLAAARRVELLFEPITNPHDHKPNPEENQS